MGEEGVRGGAQAVRVRGDGLAAGRAQLVGERRARTQRMRSAGPGLLAGSLAVVERRGDLEGQGQGALPVERVDRCRHRGGVAAVRAPRRVL